MKKLLTLSLFALMLLCLIVPSAEAGGRFRSVTRVRGVGFAPSVAVGTHFVSPAFVSPSFGFQTQVFTSGPFITTQFVPQNSLFLQSGFRSSFGFNSFGGGFGQPMIVPTGRFVIDGFGNIIFLP